MQMVYYKTKQEAEILVNKNLNSKQEFEAT